MITKIRCSGISRCSAKVRIASCLEHDGPPQHTEPRAQEPQAGARGIGAVVEVPARLRFRVVVPFVVLGFFFFFLLLEFDANGTVQPYFSIYIYIYIYIYICIVHTCVY